MKKLLAAIDRVSIWSGKAVGIFVLVMCFAITAEVVMRYVFHSPTDWAVEVMCMSSAVLYIMGGAWTSQCKRHIQMQIVYSKLSRRNKAILDSVTFLFFLLYICFLLWGSTVFSLDSIRILETTGSPFNSPVYPVKIVLALGTLLILLQGIAMFIRDLYFAFKGEEL